MALLRREAWGLRDAHCFLLALVRVEGLVRGDGFLGEVCLVRAM